MSHGSAILFSAQFQINQEKRMLPVEAGSDGPAVGSPHLLLLPWSFCINQYRWKEQKTYVCVHIYRSSGELLNKNNLEKDYVAGLCFLTPPLPPKLKLVFFHIIS